MTPERLEEIRARHAKATPGPYRWRGYGTNHTISLDSVASGNEVLGFRRWGFGGAQPVFCTDGLLYAASELLVPDSAPDRKRITGIVHPDAEALQHAWQDIDELLAEVGRLRASTP